MLEIRALSPATAVMAAELFAALAGDAAHFHPHPMDAAYARALAGVPSSDVYLLAVHDGHAVAYGLLRGWASGFERPSLGVAVHPQHRGVGLGRAMVQVLHCAARIKGATSVRLKVYPDNARAVALYESLGYTWEPVLENGQLVGIANI